jgi:hypothetical protein
VDALRKADPVIAALIDANPDYDPTRGWSSYRRWTPSAC